MSNRPSWAKKREVKPPIINVHIDPSRIREGHGVSLVSREPMWHIRCKCGKQWMAPTAIKDTIEREAFEHVYEVDGAEA